DLEPMIDFGFHLGAAFQIRDDILNLVGDPGEYGKERLGDLREGKRTLMLIHLVAAADPVDRRWVEACLALDATQRSEADIQRLFDLMQAYGSIAFASEFAAGVTRSAEARLDRAFAGVPDSTARRFVGRLVPYMVERVS
ncbi:MAG: polyprenyl synthetase family protein, partial [Acidimicrobiia bacterium]